MNYPIRKKILIVDDDKSNIKIVEKIIKNCYDFDVISTTCSSKVETLVKKYKFEFIILDLAMPFKDGKLIAKDLKINPNTCNIPIIMYTGYSDYTIQYADYYVVKGTNTLNLINTIELIIQSKDSLSLYTLQTKFL